jgi:hypothetical protein
MFSREKYVREDWRGNPTITMTGRLYKIHRARIIFPLLQIDGAAT